jgi:FkbM family methyltransferase
VKQPKHKRFSQRIKPFIHRVLGNLMRRGSDTAKIYRRLGFRFILDRKSLVDRGLILARRYERRQMDYFTRITGHFRGKPDTVFLDIGAYFGIYSFVFWKTGIFEKILAFEADAHNFSQLQANIFLNNAAHNILGRNLAVSDGEGIVHLLDSNAHPDGNRAGTHCVTENSVLQKFEVESVCIDTYLNLSGMHLAIKLDIEGHEPAALRGMERTLRENKVLLQIEIFEPQQEVVFPLLDKLGLRQINAIYPDFYYTNISPNDLGV